LSVFLGIIDLPTNTLSYSVGGQFPMPIFKSAEGVRYLIGRNQPVGLFEFAEYESYELPLGQDFELVAVSDGILEVLTQARLSDKEAYLLDLVEQNKLTVENLQEVLALRVGQEVPDDITLLTLRRTRD